MPSMHDDIRAVVQHTLLYSKNQLHFNTMLQEEIQRSRRFLGKEGASSASHQPSRRVTSASPRSRVASVKVTTTATPKYGRGQAAVADVPASGTARTGRSKTRLNSSPSSQRHHGDSVSNITVKVRDAVVKHDRSSSSRSHSRSKSECRICGCDVNRHQDAPCVQAENAALPARKAMKSRSRSSRSQSSPSHAGASIETLPPRTHVDVVTSVPPPVESFRHRTRTSLHDDHFRIATLREEFDRLADETLTGAAYRSRGVRIDEQQQTTKTDDAALARIDAQINGIKATLETVAQGLDAVTSTVNRVAALGPPNPAAQPSPVVRSLSRRTSVTFDTNFVFPTEPSAPRADTKSASPPALGDHLVRPKPLDGRHATGDDGEVLQQWEHETENEGPEHHLMPQTPHSDLMRGSSLEPSSPSSRAAESAKSSLREPLGMPPVLAMSFDAAGQPLDNSSPNRDDVLRASDLLSPTDFGGRAAEGVSLSPAGNGSMSERGSSALTPTSERIYTSKRRLSKALKPISAPTSIGAVLGRDRAFESLGSGSVAPESPVRAGQSSPPAVSPPELVLSPSAAARAPTVPPERGDSAEARRSASALIDLQAASNTAPPSPAPAPNVLQPPRPSSPPLDSEFTLPNGSFAPAPGMGTAAPSPTATPHNDDLAPSSHASSPLVLASTGRGPQPSIPSSFRLVETGPISSPTSVHGAARGRYQKVLQHKRSDSLVSIDDSIQSFAPTVPAAPSTATQTPSDEAVQATPATVSEGAGTSSPLYPTQSAASQQTAPTATSASAAGTAPGIDVNAMMLALMQGMMQQQQQLLALQQQQHQAPVAPQVAGSVEGSRRTSTSSPSPIPPGTTAAYLQALAAAREALKPYRFNADDAPEHRVEQPVPTPRQNAAGTRIVRGRPPTAPSSVVRRTSSASAATDKTVPATSAPTKRAPLPRSYATTHLNTQSKVIYLGAVDRPTCSSLAHSSLRYRAEHALAPEDAHCPDCYAVNARRDSEDPAEEASHSRLFSVPQPLRVHLH